MSSLRFDPEEGAMRKLVQRGIMATLVSIAITCCGRTGLLVPEVDDCTSVSATAEVAQLDVFIIMDSSRSMEFETADGTTKWAAVRTALESFLLDADSRGLGVAISFFPEIDPNVPELCSDDASCNVGACAQFKVCLPDAGIECKTDADCSAAGAPMDTCEPFGFCAGDSSVGCLMNGTDYCGILGPCFAGYCENHYACSASAYYSGSALDVGILPGAAGKVLQAVDSRIPDGSTPTLPALAGTHDRVADYAAGHPGDKPIVLLATDGLPTVCDPALDSDTPELGIEHLANVAAAGAFNGVQTFVIGVFAPDEQEEAIKNLDTIAAGGQTKSAFVISTSEDVTDRFLEALNDVRKTAKGCEFAIPQGGSAPADANRLRVHITPPGGSLIEIPRRSSIGACDPQTGGFTFDKDPAGPVKPGRIILCPQSCALFGSAPERTIDISVSCDD
jgi:Mg-chelatase subunit ChlD